MERYLGVKIVEAKLMSNHDFYGKYRGQVIDAKEEDMCGYMVKYEDGYESWSPKSTFEKAYRKIDHLNFGLAIEALKKGNKLFRKGWNGKGAFIVLMDGMKLPPYSSQESGKKVNDRTAQFIGIDTPLETLPYIAMYTSDGKWLPGWLASQTDILAEDWEIVGDFVYC